MYKGTQSSAAFLDRTASHSTKPSKTTLSVCGQDGPSADPCLTHTVRVRELGKERLNLLIRLNDIKERMQRTRYLDEKKDLGNQHQKLQHKLGDIRREIIELSNGDFVGLYWKAAKETLPQELFDDLKRKVRDLKREINAELGFDLDRVRHRGGSIGAVTVVEV